MNGEERTLRSVFHTSASSADSLDSPCEETILCGDIAMKGSIIIYRSIILPESILKCSFDLFILVLGYVGNA